MVAEWGISGNLHHFEQQIPLLGSLKNCQMLWLAWALFCVFIDYDLIAAEQLCGETKILLANAFKYLFDFINVLGHVFEILV